MLSWQDRKEVLQNMFARIGSSKSDYYCERCNQLLRIFIPTLPTVKRDRL